MNILGIYFIGLVMVQALVLAVCLGFGQRYALRMMVAALGLFGLWVATLFLELPYERTAINVYVPLFVGAMMGMGGVVGLVVKWFRAVSRMTAQPGGEAR